MLREERAPTTSAAAPLRATPLARALARIHGIDLAALAGSGPDGRVMARDVRARAAPEAPTTALAPPGAVPSPMSSSGAATASAQQEVARDTDGLAWREVSGVAPVATVMLEFDAGPALARVAELGEEFARQGWPLHLGIAVAAAAVELLPAHPHLNGGWLGDTLALQRAVHLAVAELTPEGLRWSVLPDAGDLGLRGLARALAGRPARGAATFALVSLAAGKSWWSAPPPLPGTVAALILGAPQRRVVAVDSGLSMRPIATLTLSYDARALDQRQALDFLEALRTRLENKPI
ncbi:MAG: 2-oxo acid dehydrogenase subunit E2 [Oscillochloridaceae bacterium]|nr:2-oxo acid dehydrogenase subunit E2 [Chloroflexaceae bacterium]MDW8391237.1 2-oxo acid dehydrogenase subunit E2 [Oscillochloridaceae bacterium]